MSTGIDDADSCDSCGCGLYPSELDMGRCRRCEMDAEAHRHDDATFERERERNLEPEPDGFDDAYGAVCDEREAVDAARGLK